jgi:hypothetical protein
MEIKVTPIRGAVLLALLVAFYFWGGFEILDGVSRRRLSRGWTTCILMFVAGAVSISIVDHWVGNVERSNIRIFYIIAGILLMAVALVWQAMLNSSLEVALIPTR